jgi:hypothetical protein
MRLNPWEKGRETWKQGDLKKSSSEFGIKQESRYIFQNRN